MTETKYSARASGIIAILSDKPVAYHPALAKQIGVKEAIFLCQLLYWDGKGARPDGWIWKCQEKMTDETGLSRTEQETVRKHLIALGIMEEKLMSIPATMHFKINFDKLAEIVEKEYATNSERPRNQVCGSHAGFRAKNPQSIPENTSETTTEDNILLSCSNEHDNTLSEYGEVTPSIEEPCPDSGTSPSLGTDPATLNSAAPRRRIDAGNGELYPHTPGGALLFSLCGREAVAKGLSMPQKYPSVTMRDKFLEAEQRLGMDGLRGAILKAIEAMGYVSLTRMIQYVSKVAGNGSPAKSTLPPLLFQKVAEAIRYNPEAQEHIPRISRLTETCQQRGYTEEQVRKAGKLWWETWPGNGGKGPTDAEFLQKIEIVKKERV